LQLSKVHSGPQQRNAKEHLENTPHAAKNDIGLVSGCRKPPGEHTWLFKNGSVPAYRIPDRICYGTVADVNVEQTVSKETLGKIGVHFLNVGVHFVGTCDSRCDV